MLLRQTFFAGIRWTSLASFTNFALGVIQVAVLARFLSKSDFAWVAIAGVFVNTGLQLQSAGINAAIVQKQENAREVLSSLFWLNLGIGVLLFLIMLILAPILVAIYKIPELLHITIIYSAILLVHALNVQYKALFQKNLFFSALSIGDLIGGIVGFTVACWSAVQGLGAYALVFGYLGRALAETIFVMMAGRQLFAPRFFFDFQLIKSYLVFSGFHWSERIVVQIGGQLDVLLIGKLLGSEALGIYDIFKRILIRPFNLINDVLEKITFPVMSQLQKNVHRQRQLFFQLLIHLNTLNLPILIGLTIIARPLLGWYLGADWTEQVLIFRLLCGFCLFHYLLNPVDTLLLAQGQIQKWFFANLLLLPLQGLFIAIGSQWGLTGAVAGNVIIYACFTWLSYQKLILPSLQSSLYELFKQTSAPVFIAFVSACLALPIIFVILNTGMILALLIFAIAYSFLTFRYNYSFFYVIVQLLKR